MLSTYPFFAVLRPDKPTSPVRIVMNGKAVFGPNKISLNDCIARGPKLLNNLVEVLMKFRQQPIGVTCDIKEMFLNVYMPPEDWDWHRFFYTLPGEDNSRIYRAKVHQFGSRGSPDSTCFAMKLHALINIIKLVMASLAILDHCIVDDGLIPVKDREYGLKLVQELIDFAAGLGMKVHKWASNDPSILPPGTPQRDLVELNSMDLEAQYPEGKALGIVWHTKTDEMAFAPLKPTLAVNWTKRMALSCLMSFYSPDGLGLPLEMSGRFLFRQTWELGLDWDEQLNPTFTRKWKAWEHQMGHVGHIRYPRSVGTKFMQAHIFCDASGEGYGAVAYIKTDLGVFVCYAKGKIVKSISLTIPTLEIEACVCGKKLINTLKRVYKLNNEDIHFWSDSHNALSWIMNPSRDLPKPIARRATMLREETTIENWHYVPTDLNPADVLSRGCKAINLVNHKLWWNGPDFLHTENWPLNPIKPKPHIQLPDEEALSRMVGIFTLLDPEKPTKLPTLFMTSSFRRGCRILFWVQLFISKTRKLTNLPNKSELLD